MIARVINTLLVLRVIELYIIVLPNWYFMYFNVHQ